MIKINLAKRNRKAATNAFTLTSLTRTSELKNFFQNIFKKQASIEGPEKKFDINGPIPKLILAVAVIYLVDDFIVKEKANKLESLDKQVVALQKQKDEFSASLSKVKGFELTKRQLEEDEQAIRVKLETVNTLLENRNAPSKLMLQVAQAIPEEVWLTDFKVTEETARLSGTTPGYNQASDFIKNLNATGMFNDIGLSGIQETSSASNDQRYQTFELSAKRRQGG